MVMKKFLIGFTTIALGALLVSACCNCEKAKSCEDKKCSTEQVQGCGCCTDCNACCKGDCKCAETCIDSTACCSKEQKCASDTACCKK